VYDVLFKGLKVYIQPRGLKQAKMVEIMTRKLYRLQFELPQDLVSNNKNMGELWHRMAHLHHGALNVLEEIVTCLPELASSTVTCVRGVPLESMQRQLF
jgi:hypothetical protein